MLAREVGDSIAQFREISSAQYNEKLRISKNLPMTILSAPQKASRVLLTTTDMPGAMKGTNAGNDAAVPAPTFVTA